MSATDWCGLSLGDGIAIAAAAYLLRYSVGAWLRGKQIKLVVTAAAKGFEQAAEAFKDAHK